MVKRQKTKALDIRATVPERVVEWEEPDDRQVVLLVPKFRGRLFGRFLTERLSRPFFKVHLDTFGSVVWHACDGSRTVAEIEDLLVDTFGDEVSPVTERLGLFVQQLSTNRLITLKELVPLHI